MSEKKKQPMIVGKNAPPVGEAPAILLTNPKYSANVGAAVRAASCFGAKQVWWTGNRVSLNAEEGQRLPREERMKGYKEVDMVQFDYPFDHFKGVVPVCLEVGGTENLFDFVHPENALYVFGPEDGSVDQMYRRFCHRFVKIPTRHCTNLAAAVYIVLYDRAMKHYQLTQEMPELNEQRGYIDTLANEDVWKEAGYKHGVAFV